MDFNMTSVCAGDSTQLLRHSTNNLWAQIDWRTFNNQDSEEADDRRDREGRDYNQDSEEADDRRDREGRDYNRDSGEADDRRDREGRDYNQDSEEADGRRDTEGRDYNQDSEEADDRRNREGRDYNQDSEEADGRRDREGRDYNEDSEEADDRRDREGRDYNQDSEEADDRRDREGRDYNQDSEEADDRRDREGRDYNQDSEEADDRRDREGRDYNKDSEEADDRRDREGRDYNQDSEEAYDRRDREGRDYNQDSEEADDRRDREGTHEVQVSEGGEADLHEHYNTCKKNPGHTHFVPINNFNINHLPKGYHDDDIVDFIKVTADLTVRVNVQITSTQRPQFWPETNFPYHFYNLTETGVMRLGTEMVIWVNKHTEKDIEKYGMTTCTCQKCKHSDTPSKEWGEISIYTATHVVFDDLEARHTTCRLFYDRQECPLVSLGGWNVVRASIIEDRCELICVACDVDLLDKLEAIWRKWCVVCSTVYNKYKSSKDEYKLTFIVSHPHGCSKAVSVGQWIKRTVILGDRTMYTYTTCTCPGSSGAYVHSLGFYNNGWIYEARHVHSGVSKDGQNFCGIGQDWELFRGQI